MLPNAPDGRLRMRNPVPGPRGGGLYVSELQRTRLLEAAFVVVAAQGYRGMAARAVAERAGVSPKTFYDLFSDREDCFLAAFDHGVEQLAAIARPAYEAESEWAAGIRAGLGALLAFLDREPALRRLVFVEALGVGPRVLECRAQVLGELAKVIDKGRAGVKGAGELPPLTAEGVVGAAFGVIHARLSERSPEALGGLLSALMATIVLPYRGRAAAARELARPTPPSGWGGASRSRTQEAKCASHTSDRGRRDAQPIPALTVRTHSALQALAQAGGRGSHPSNREISDLIGVSDQGQISRLMMRLQAEGLAENTGGHGQGAAKAWRLTPHGEAVMQANRPIKARAA
jgi:AcrR family transcriptional regulator/DNA-binding MarR family transcriptional regulator